MKIYPTLLAAVWAACGPDFAVAQDITGSWSLTATPGSINTCPGKAEVVAYQWTVTENGGEISVAVQGETEYPKLTGKLENGRLVLDGEAKTRVMSTGYPNSVFVLDVKGRTVSGTRYVIHFKPAKQGGMTTCLLTYTVRGRVT